MKKIIIVVFGVLLLLALSLILFPILFKDQVKGLVERQIEKSIDANVYYDHSSIELSFFSNFPNLTLKLGEFGVVGRNPFLEDTLIAAKNFQIAIDPFEIVFGDNLLIRKINLQNPQIELLKLESGLANWDIVKTNKKEDPGGQGGDPGKSAKIQIDQWTINDGRLTIIDETKGLAIRLQGFSHSGSGNFSSSEFDLNTSTQIEKSLLINKGKVYLKNARLEADVTTRINNETRTIIFKKNEFKINDFSFGIDGKINFDRGPKDLDLTFSTNNTSFKNLLSLVPAIYKKDYTQIKTQGNIAFSGNVKGPIGDENYPAFFTELKVEDGMFQFPGHNVPISHINIDAEIKNDGGSLENTLTNISSFHFELGENPVDLRAKLKGISDLDIDAELHAFVNLEDLTKFYPLEGLEMRGILKADGKAKGIFSKGNMPNLNADLDLSNGYLKSNKLDAPVKDLTLKAKITSPGGSMKYSSINLDLLKFNLAENDVNIHGTISDLESYGYDVSIDGKFDLDAFSKLFPMEGLSASGIVTTNINTRGSYDLIKEEKYDLLSSSGTIALNNIIYKSQTLAGDLKISIGKLSISPNKIKLQTLKGMLGKSDFSITGNVSNYLGYVFQNQKILGQLNWNSRLLDLNEWMVEKKKTNRGGSGNQTEERPILVPPDLNFSLVGGSDKVLLNDLNLTNFHGSVTINNGILEMKNLHFKTFGGVVSSSGYYDTQAPINPKYSMDLSVANLDIPEAYSTLNTVSFLAPSFEKMTGKAHSEIHLEGVLNSKMENLIPAFVGNGRINIRNGSISNVDLVNKMMNTVNIPGMRNWIKSEYRLSDFEAHLEVVNGRAYFKPFKVVMNTHPFEFSGSYGLDGGTLDYLVATEFKPASLGTFANVALGALLGGDYNPDQVIEIDFKITGDRKNPQVNLLGMRPKTLIKSEEDPMVHARKEADQKLEEERNNQEIELEKIRIELKKQAGKEAKRRKKEAAQKETENLLDQLKSKEKGGD